MNEPTLPAAPPLDPMLAQHAPSSPPPTGLEPGSLLADLCLEAQACDASLTVRVPRSLRDALNQIAQELHVRPGILIRVAVRRLVRDAASAIDARRDR